MTDDKKLFRVAVTRETRNTRSIGVYADTKAEAERKIKAFVETTNDLTSDFTDFWGALVDARMSEVWDVLEYDAFQTDEEPEDFQHFLFEENTDE